MLVVSGFAGTGLGVQADPQTKIFGPTPRPGKSNTAPIYSISFWIEEPSVILQRNYSYIMTSIVLDLY